MHAAFVKSGDPSTAAEGRFLHGYYSRYCYLPLYVFCGRHLLGCAIRRWDHRALGVPTVPHGGLDKFVPAWACIEDVLMAKLAALAAALLLYSPSALAWGGLGHEAICELAFLELDDTARQRVIALIRQDPEFSTFRASCNWPDRPRQRAREHFVNLPRDAIGLDGNDCPLADECVVSAIEHDFAVLESPDATDEEKLAALKFLGHWVGDVHQPLHGASRDDRGGNHIRTRGSTCRNLHTLWDSCIIEERLGMHPLAIVPELRAGITDEQRAKWLASDPVDWANESFTIARKPEVGYCVMVGDTCQYAADNVEFEEGEPEKVVAVDDGYLDMHAPIARERIAMAGVRLASLLNRALAFSSWDPILARPPQP